MNNNIHEDFKAALRVLNLTATGWANTLVKPDGEIGISHTAVILVAQGKADTAWIRAEIKQLIKEAKKKAPKLFPDREKRGSYAL